MIEKDWKEMTKYEKLFFVCAALACIFSLGMMQHTFQLLKKYGMEMLLAEVGDTFYALLTLTVVFFAVAMWAKLQEGDLTEEKGDE